MDSPVYEPREDTFLIVDASKSLVKGKVLEVGCGSGYVSYELSKIPGVREVVGVDINPVAVKESKMNYSKKNLVFFESDMFKNVKGKFDFIICNPPYLPQDYGVVDVALYGGRKGYEYIERLLGEVEEYLEDDGSLILLFSSLSRKRIVDSLVEKNFFEYEKLREEHVGGFETLYVYRIMKRKEFVELKKRGVTEIRFFSKGRRGFIFTGKHEGIKAGVKVHNTHSEADTVTHEGEMLRSVNKLKIGPEFLFRGDGFVTYKFFEGVRIDEWVKDKDKKKTIQVLKEVFSQLRRLDKALIDKKEMSHPHKHILVNDKEKICLIDFERGRRTERPCNVTGFCQFVTSNVFGEELKNNELNIDKEEMIIASKDYKKTYSKESYEKIISLLK